jgi:hypothetical protein
VAFCSILNFHGSTGYKYSIVLFNSGDSYMKKFILLALVLVSSVVHAAEVVVMEAELPMMNETRALHDTRFYMDTKTGEGYVKAAVSEERYTDFPGQWGCSYDPYGRCIPTSRQPMPTQVMVFSGSKKVEGLMLMGDQAVYQSAAGNVVCGTMGVSRVFKIPTLYLSGNCSLSSTIVRVNGMSRKLVVTLKTK